MASQIEMQPAGEKSKKRRKTSSVTATQISEIRELMVQLSIFKLNNHFANISISSIKMKRLKMPKYKL